MAGEGRPKFCAKGSVFRPGAAEAFERWATAKVRSPPPERLHEHLEVRVTDDLGVHVAAARSFDVGDLVISEEALVKLPDAPQGARLRLERSFGERAAFFSPAIGVDWSAVDEETRRAALTLFFVHPTMSKPGSRQVDSNIECTKKLLANAEPALREAFHDPMDLLRFLHIVDLNIHRDEERPEHAEFTGIFVFGSKFSHSCAPNCSWAFSREGRLQYTALRPIKSGDLLTFSYIGNGMNLLTSTIDRRRRLSTLWFVCQCARCVGPDLARWLRCPRCRSHRGCLPEYSEDRGSSSGRPAHVDVQDAARWRCQACRETMPASAMPLKDEADLTRLVPEAMMRATGVSALQEARLFEQLRGRAAATVGKEHWTHTLAGFAWLQRWLAALRSEPIIERGEEEFQVVSKDIATWLRENAAENSEQRLSALFAALRLEHNLGGGLAAWGYDPARPLGDLLNALPQLESCGWRINAEGGVEAIEERGRARAADAAA